VNFWGYTIDTPVEWAAMLALVTVALIAYFSLVWFVQKYATGMVAGFLLMATGFGLILGPTFYLIRSQAPVAQQVMSIAAIFAGCVTILVGAFSLRDYEDF